MTKVLSFSGHRYPTQEKLNEDDLLLFCSFLKRNIDEFFQSPKNNLDNIGGFISGGALGFDFAAQQFALEHKIPLCIALPYSLSNFTKSWSSTLKSILDKHLTYATDIVQVDTRPYYKFKYSLDEGSYHIAKLQWRNEYMINHSDQTVFYLNPSSTKGGTYNAMQYCKKVNQPYQNIWLPFN